MNKRVLVTGASGFIGRHTLQPLLDRGFEVYAMVNNNSLSKQDGINIVQCNMLDEGSRFKTLGRIQPEYLLHLAWNVNSGYASSALNIDWLMASLKLIGTFYSAGGKRAVVAGTCFEYDVWDIKPHYAAQTAAHPHTMYGVCKSSLYNMLSQLHQDKDWAWGRIFFLYGPQEKPQRLVPSVINGLLKEGVAKVGVSGEQGRDFLYVQDVADALVHILDSNLRGAINIGPGENITIRNLVTRIWELMDIPNSTISYGNSDTNEPLSILAAPGALYDTLGWNPKISLNRGLLRTIDYWKRILEKDVE